MLRRSIVFLVVLWAVSAAAQNHFNPAVAVAPNGTVAIASSVSAADGGGVSIIYRDTAGRLSAPVVVNAGMPGAGQNPALCFDRSNLLTIVWEQWGASSARVFIAQYAPDGRVRVPAHCVTDDPAMNAQTPRLAVGRHGSCAVVWLDYRRGAGAVCLQRFLPGLRKAGKNIFVAASETVLQTPVVALEAEDRIACAWQAAMGDSFCVVAQTGTWAGRWQPAVIVDEGKGKAYASTPDIAAAPDAGFAVVWKDYRTGESDIYFQALARMGTKIGSNFRVNDDTTLRWQRLPRIVVSSAGMLVVWEDYRNDPGNQIGDIYAQRLDRTGKMIGHNFTVSDGPEPTIQRFPAAGMNQSGACVVVWDDGRTETTSVWLRQWSDIARGGGPEVKIAP